MTQESMTIIDQAVGAHQECKGIAMIMEDFNRIPCPALLFIRHS